MGVEERGVTVKDTMLSRLCVSSIRVIKSTIIALLAPLLKPLFLLAACSSCMPNMKDMSTGWYTRGGRKKKREYTMTMMRLMVDSFNWVPSLESLEECKAVNRKRRNEREWEKEGMGKRQKRERSRKREREIDRERDRGREVVRDRYRKAAWRRKKIGESRREYTRWEVAEWLEY